MEGDASAFFVVIAGKSKDSIMQLSSSMSKQASEQTNNQNLYFLF